jgi:diaminopimelate decarboxylase
MVTLPDRILTYGESLDPAMKITDQTEADEYFEALVQNLMKFGHKTREESTRIQKSNLGYYAGYYDDETMRRVNRLFKIAHPIFGNSSPTPEEAFETGKAIGGTP